MAQIIVLEKRLLLGKADIKYHDSYLFDFGLIPGAFYKRVGNSLIFHEFPIPKKVDQYLDNLFKSAL